MVLRMKNFNIFRGSLKNWIFRVEGGGGSRKTNIDIEGGLPEMGRYGQFADLRGGRTCLARKKGRDCF